MRFALVSDIHGNLPALEAVLADAARRGAGRVLNLGDSLSGPLLPRETADFLMATDWVHLAGNHERQLLTEDPAEMGESDAYTHGCLTEAHRAWMAGLPGTLALDGEVFLCHATPGSDLVYFLHTLDGERLRPASPEEMAERVAPVRHAVVACGHSHLPRVVRLPSGQLMVNPGSVGLQAFRVDRFQPHAVATGSPEARYALLEKVDGRWDATVVEVPYDPVPMARLAERRGRPGWVSALLEGVC